mmetsp:Transcript_14485/g.24707  ORF Transcript_14485/g.24707 Transcript_14485/m.24707 type:complete len:412 (+) Transcript_14485:61-1296(+)
MQPKQKQSLDFQPRSGHFDRVLRKAMDRVRTRRRVSRDLDEEDFPWGLEYAINSRDFQSLSAFLEYFCEVCRPTDLQRLSTQLTDCLERLPEQGLDPVSLRRGKYLQSLLRDVWYFEMAQRKSLPPLNSNSIHQTLHAMQLATSHGDFFNRGRKLIPYMMRQNFQNVKSSLLQALRVNLLGFSFDGQTVKTLSRTCFRPLGSSVLFLMSLRSIRRDPTIVRDLVAEGFTGLLLSALRLSAHPRLFASRLNCPTEEERHRLTKYCIRLLQSCLWCVREETELKHMLDVCWELETTFTDLCDKFCSCRALGSPSATSRHECVAGAAVGSPEEDTETRNSANEGLADSARCDSHLRRVSSASGRSSTEAKQMPETSVALRDDIFTPEIREMLGATVSSLRAALETLTMNLCSTF